MQRIYQLSVLTFTLCGFLILTACGGSSTGSGKNNPPEAPSNLSGSSGDQQIKLTWDANSEGNISGYNLYRSASSFTGTAGKSPVNGSDLITNPTYTDTELENGTTYYYRITAVDKNNNESKVSAQLQLTPFSGPPDRP